MDGELRALLNAVLERLDVQGAYIEQMRMDIVKLQGSVKQLEDKVDRLQSDVDAMKKDMDAMKKDMDAMKKDMDAMKKDMLGVKKMSPRSRKGKRGRKKLWSALPSARLNRKR
ncbi:hypothetical protein [Geobacillus zalihae]|uniref:hypothetical protein n=1 Tax=Geobacillus zalihae TaxID=213419 RepID=UPI001CC216E2|nr:hypothetical protein [Geobacillus zalihae]